VLLKSSLIMIIWYYRDRQNWTKQTADYGTRTRNSCLEIVAFIAIFISKALRE